ncbi:hypothetical protein niasHT_009291 [Heterodera trifolii]|uniref:Uncharacterized protein n=1 Tax=Heterodera trifolii TaxID=157864 RepID=A0ABD2MD42_9BILA
MGRTKCVESSLVLRGSGKGGRGSKDARGVQQTQQAKTGFDGRSEAPMRKTATAFRQPVTLVHTTSRRSHKAPERKQTNNTAKEESIEKAEKGRQVFWAKSLEGLRAMVPLRLADKFSAEDDFNITQRMELPQKIEAMVPSMSEDAAAATFCSSLHTFELNGSEIVGQQATRKQIEENPFDTLKFVQPFVQIPTITEQDILAQERRVLDARKRLQELRKSFLIK